MLFPASHSQKLLGSKQPNFTFIWTIIVSLLYFTFLLDDFAYRIMHSIISKLKLIWHLRMLLVHYFCTSTLTARIQLKWITFIYYMILFFPNCRHFGDDAKTVSERTTKEEQILENLHKRAHLRSSLKRNYDEIEEPISGVSSINMQGESK